MKKMIMIAAAFGIAMAFTACGDDSSSSSSGSSGGFCLTTYGDGSMDCSNSSISMTLCGGSGSMDGTSFSSSTVAACPENPTLSCTESDGATTNYYNTIQNSCPTYK